MIKFKQINVNPKGRKTGDCCVRAITNVLGISYAEAIDLCAESAKKRCYGITNKETLADVLKKFGYVKMKQPRKLDGTKYTVREADLVLTKEQMKEGVLITVAGHDTVVRDGYCEDTWDCRYKCISNYYVKA